MTDAERLAAFICRSSYADLSADVRQQLKIRVLDAVGCAIGALGNFVTGRILAQTEEFGGASLCTLIGGGRSAPDRAAFYNSALIRYLDFNDSYLSKGETCHPSDNTGTVLAACEYATGSGRDFLTALAVAYQVQCRLSDVAPVRDKGFDHTTQGSYAIAGGVSKALNLDEQHTANALAMCGASFNALRVTRTGVLSNWKGLAYPNTAFGALHATFLAMHGITGPLEVFEGNKGFKEAIAGPFEIDWAREGLDRVTRTIVKKYNAEIHSQSAIEGMLELRQQGLAARDVDRIDLETFDVAFHIIGGGEEGNKKVVHTKEAADHSLPYLLAVALLDGEVMPGQYLPERIRAHDVQSLLQKVDVRAAMDLSERFPKEMPCRIEVRRKDGKILAIEKNDYEGFLTRPMGWDGAARKFHSLSGPFTSAALRERIVECVEELEGGSICELTSLLQQVVMPPVEPTEKVPEYGCA